MRRHSPTRGFGLLETWLARARARKADALIPNELRGGTVVDIGCGVPPLFLEGTLFARKIGVDARAEPGTNDVTGITVLRWNANDTEPLPLPNAAADVIVLLAVIEHVENDRIEGLLLEIKRLLRARGALIVTTPRPIAAPVLRAMASIGLVSKEEIREHKRLIGTASLVAHMENAGFSPHGIEHGTFECGMNSWIVARA